MSIVSNYQEYRKYKPQYKTWDENQKEKEAKRLAYINRTNYQNQNDVKRATAVLNAIDVMDEYSQTRAEDMELTTQSAKGTIISLISQLSLIPAGFIALKTGFGQKITNAIAKGMGNNKFIQETAPIYTATLLSLVPSVASFGFLSIWGAKKETQASRHGRSEAMTNELSDVKQFAILDENQEKKRDELASTIQIDEKQAKKGNNANKGLGIIQSFKILFKRDDKVNEEQEKFKKDLEEQETKIGSLKLSDTEIEEAKKRSATYFKCS